MGYGDDINLVLPVEEYDEVRKSSQHDATGSMQIDGITLRTGRRTGKAGQ